LARDWANRCGRPNAGVNIVVRNKGELPGIRVGRIADVMRRIKGRTSRKIQIEYPELRKKF